VIWGSRLKSTPLEIAIYYDQLNVVKWFDEQQHGIDLHSLDKRSKNGLISDAVEGNALSVIKYLAKRGIELDKKGMNDIDPINRAYIHYGYADAALLLLSKGAKFKFKESTHSGSRMSEFGSYILEDTEIFVRCGDAILENLAGGLNILSTCLKEIEDQQIKAYINSMLPKLIKFITESDLNFKTLKVNCKTIDNVRELSFQATKVLEIYENNKEDLVILPELTRTLSNKKSEISKLKGDFERLEIESTQFGFFKLGFQEGLEQMEKDVYKEIISLKPELFTALLDYFDPQRTFCLSELELLDSEEYDIEAVGEAEG